MQHLGSKTPAKCAVCGKEEGTPGTYPLVIGVGRVCMSCGMGKVRCDVCGEEVKRLTSRISRASALPEGPHEGDREVQAAHHQELRARTRIRWRASFQKAIGEQPEGYTLLALRRARNSTPHTWETQSKKTEIFQTKCS